MTGVTCRTTCDPSSGPRGPDIHQNGYAGALSWDYATGAKNLGNVQAFAATHAYETHFDLTAKDAVGSFATAPAPRSVRLCERGPDGRPVCR
ncbi:MAG TPA: hypothetical protein VF316_02635 [Polyangiaceae bacterium]